MFDQKGLGKVPSPTGNCETLVGREAQPGAPLELGGWQVARAAGASPFSSYLGSLSISSHEFLQSPSPGADC